MSRPAMRAATGVGFLGILQIDDPMGMVRLGSRHPNARVSRPVLTSICPRGVADSSTEALRPASRRRVRTPFGARSRATTLGHALALLLLLLAASPAFAQAQSAGVDAPAAEELDGPVFFVSRFVLAYPDPHPDLPPIDSLLPFEVELRRTATGWASPRAGAPSQKVRIGTGDVAEPHFHASALGAVSRTLLSRVHDAGLMGVYVRPSAEDIDIQTETDRRAEGDTHLRLQIWVGRIDAVRTVAAGDRVKDGWTIDNPIHRKIRAYSPLHPAAAGIDETTDLLDQRKLEDYVYRLNRHPGRHVEASLAASDDSDGITLDYRVYESRPWNIFAQVSNTGSERTGRWQSRIGYVNRELTNHDDILSIEYMNAGIDNVHSVQAAYDAPWFAPKRPVWMNTTGNEPSWLAWADRSKVPWWGLGRLRWRMQGGWTGIYTDINELEFGGFIPVDTVSTSDWYYGGRLTYNVYQYRNLFIDLFADGRFRGVQVDNDSTSNQADVHLLVGDMGVAAERSNQFSNLEASFSVTGGTPIGDSSGDQAAFAANLGRSLTDSTYWTLNYDVGISYFLEPLLFPRSWTDPNSAWTSTLSHEVAIATRGQYAFDYRLIPQSAQVIGGLYSVRGFPNGVAVGDSIYLGTAEYRFHIPRSLPIRRQPVDLPWVGDFRISPQQVYGRPDWDLIFRAFVDAGRSVRNDRQLATGTEVNQTLVGAGVGLEFIFRGNLRARVDWAHGIYQSTECDPIIPGTPSNPAGGTDLACQSALEGDIDPSGELYFLFSVVF